jgi:hypothetical protein
LFGKVANQLNTTQKWIVSESMTFAKWKRKWGNIIMLELVRDSRMVFPVLDDEYIEKMANFYTSETAQVIFPNLHRIPFEEWLYRQYFLMFKRSGRK